MPRTAPAAAPQGDQSVKYLPDTDICIALINERPQGVIERFRRHEVGDIGVSSITVNELAFGVAKTGSKRNAHTLHKFLLPLEIMPFTADAAFVAGTVRAVLEKRGKPIGPMDLLIASHAKALDVTVVTNNTREFGRVPGLKVQNWVTDT